MAAHLPIGIDDFQKLREAGLEYVDKSRMIEELLDLEGVEVLLLPRPRRFGKTLNLSMLRCFFERRSDPSDISRYFSSTSSASMPCQARIFLPSLRLRGL